MEQFLKELLADILRSGEHNIRISFDLDEQSMLKLIKARCFELLFQIRKIVSDDTLDDFSAIEEILELLKDLDSVYRASHDFG